MNNLAVYVIGAVMLLAAGAALWAQFAAHPDVVDVPRVKPGMVYVESSGTPRGTKVYGDDGRELRGIRSVFIDCTAGADMVGVSVEFSSAAYKMHGQPTFQVVDPRSGHLKGFDSIQFTDGTYFGKLPRRMRIATETGGFEVIDTPGEWVEINGVRVSKELLQSMFVSPNPMKRLMVKRVGDEVRVVIVDGGVHA